MLFESWLGTCGRSFNGYPWSMHRRINHENLYVRDYDKEGKFSTLSNGAN